MLGECALKTEPVDGSYYISHRHFQNHILFDFRTVLPTFGYLSETETKTNLKNRKQQPFLRFPTKKQRLIVVFPLVAKPGKCTYFQDGITWWFCVRNASDESRKYLETCWKASKNFVLDSLGALL